MVRALDGKKGGRGKGHSRHRPAERSDKPMHKGAQSEFKTPFRFKPPGQPQGTYSFGGSNYKGPIKGFKKGGDGYVPLSFGRLQSHARQSNSGFSESQSARKFTQSDQFSKKAKLCLQSSEKSTTRRPTKILHSKLVENNQRPNNFEDHSGNRNKFRLNPNSIKNAQAKLSVSDRKRLDDNRDSGNAEQKHSSQSSRMSGSVSEQLVFSCKKGGDQRPVLNLKYLNNHDFINTSRWKGCL